MGKAALVQAIRVSLRSAADPARAPAMQAYMKSAMPFLGVRVPVVRKLVRAAVTNDPPATVEALTVVSALLWRNATHREERYAAIALIGLPMAKGAPAVLSLCTEMITTGAWWDYVDEVAHRVGEQLLARPRQLGPLLRMWAVAPDQWLRRTAIICQLGLRERTNTELLTTAIDANLADPEFFVRKAIGWALRDYARTDPAWVIDFVQARRGRLSALSTREALKHLSS